MKRPDPHLVRKVRRNRVEGPEKKAMILKAFYQKTIIFHSLIIIEGMWIWRERGKGVKHSEAKKAKRTKVNVGKRREWGHQRGRVICLLAACTPNGRLV